MRNSRFDQGQVSDMVSLYEKGESLRAIGAKFGSNAQTVRRLVAKAGAVVRPRGRPSTAEKYMAVTEIQSLDAPVTITGSLPEPSRIVSF